MCLCVCGVLRCLAVRCYFFLALLSSLASICGASCERLAVSCVVVAVIRIASIERLVCVCGVAPVA